MLLRKMRNIVLVWLFISYVRSFQQKIWDSLISSQIILRRTFPPTFESSNSNSAVFKSHFLAEFQHIEIQMIVGTGNWERVLKVYLEGLFMTSLTNRITIKQMYLICSVKLQKKIVINWVNISQFEHSNTRDYRTLNKDLYTYTQKRHLCFLALLMH